VSEPAAGPSLHHAGYVVGDIAAAIPGFVRCMGAAWDGSIFEDTLQKVKVAFLATRPGEPRLELVEPLGPDSPVSRFLRERGGGLHHLCYEVDDLQWHIAEMKRRGALIAKRPKPAVAFGGRPIAWMLTAEKLLLEFLER